MRINIDKIAYQYRVDRKAIRSILDIFIVSTSEDFQALKSALELEKIDDIKRYSHKLKSSYSYIMAEDSVEVCNKIKLEAERTNDILVIGSLVTKMFEIHKELVEEIKGVGNA